MKVVGILNDVIGPVMRGPSSSHTAGSYHLAAIARSLLGQKPAEAVCVGRVMPAKLRVTSLGGLAVAPSARALPKMNRDCPCQL